jgi:hypothetical protein
VDAQKRECRRTLGGALVEKRRLGQRPHDVPVDRDQFPEPARAAGELLERREDELSVGIILTTHALPLEGSKSPEKRNPLRQTAPRGHAI